MIHLNRELMQSSVKEKIVEKIIPESYFARSLQEFEEEKRLTIPTKRVFPFGCLYNGSSVVYFRNSCVFHWENKSDGIARIGDLSMEVPVIVWSSTLDGRAFGALDDGDRIYNPALVYTHSTNCARLLRFDKYSSLKKDSEGSSDFLGNFLLQNV